MATPNCGGTVVSITVDRFREEVKTAKTTFVLKRFQDCPYYRRHRFGCFTQRMSVFAGYGVVARNITGMYAGIDVKGKVVLVMVNVGFWNPEPYFQRQDHDLL
jgi:hypothetical protein